MSTPSGSFARTPLATLRHFVRKPREQAQVCELCAQPIGQTHCHLLELEKRRLVCACEPCSILFGGDTRQLYRRIPRDVYRLDDFRLDDHEWESLLIPINLAFFVYSSAAKKMLAQYPSPGGVMESSVDLEYWDAIAERNPVLRRLEPDVEALLLNRINDARQYFRVPIDRCFELVGIIRTTWHGLSGGEPVWKRIFSFFQELTEQAGERGA